MHRKVLEFILTVPPSTPMCSTDLEVLATRSSHAASVIMTARLLRSKCTCSIGPSNLWSTSSAYLLLLVLLLHLLVAPASPAPTTTITTTTTTETGNPQNASWTTRQHCIQTNKERPDTGGVHAWAEWNFALTCNLTTSVRGSSRKVLLLATLLLRPWVSLVHDF